MEIDEQDEGLKLNPWAVEALEEFLYFCCPECNIKSTDKDAFVNHVWSNHPKAQKMLLSLDLNIDDILKIPDESLDILNIQGDERFDVKLEIQNEDDLFNEDDFKDDFSDANEDVEIQNKPEDKDQNDKDQDDKVNLEQIKSDSKDTQCYYCGQIISVTEIKEHMSQTHGSYHGRMHGIPRPIQCENCKATFKTESALGLHLCYDQYIPKKKYGEPYKCEKCNKNYQNRKTFRYHLQSAHTAEKKYKCDKCGFSTKTSSALSSHVHRVHTKELSHMCSTCGKRFFAAVSLNKHIRSVHLKKDEEKTKEVVMFNCDHCTVSFPHKFSLVKHLESAHDIAPKRNHTCEECGKNFSTPTSLKTHINKDHPSEELLNQLECKCCDCGKSFDSADQLNTHLQSVHLREVSLGCDRCDTKWASISALQKHIAEAHKIIVYPCEICGKTFKNRYTRVAHIKELHQKTEEFACDKCPKVFTRKYLLQTHNQSIHENGGDFKCDFCDFRGCNRSRLEVHVKGSHLKNERYSCHLCKYFTFRKDCLGTHIRTVHEKNKPHKCEFCEMSFFARRDKVKHMEKHNR